MFPMNVTGLGSQCFIEQILYYYITSARADLSIDNLSIFSLVSLAQSSPSVKLICSTTLKCPFTSWYLRSSFFAYSDLTTLGVPFHNCTKTGSINSTQGLHFLKKVCNYSILHTDSVEGVEQFPVTLPLIKWTVWVSEYETMGICM